jgi:hypothetical protein
MDNGAKKEIAAPYSPYHGTDYTVGDGRDDEGRLKVSEYPRNSRLRDRTSDGQVSLEAARARSGPPGKTPGGLGGDKARLVLSIR